MKTPVILILAAIIFACFAAAPAIAHAQCAPMINGVRYLDSDCDGIIDNTDMNDANHDGLPDGDPVDNCPSARNGDCGADPLNCDVSENGQVTPLELAAGYQRDWNQNDIGDVCDDTDKDGAPDYLDNCKEISNPDQNPNACTDTDGDGFEDPIDNCQTIYNPNQQDSDKDGIGDACDNCVLVYNPKQDAADCKKTSGVPTYFNPNINPGTGSIQGQNQNPDQIQGNGLGQGGCSIGTSQGSSPYCIMLFIAAALLVLRRQKSNQ